MDSGRVSYDSLTEPRGTFLIRKQAKEKAKEEENLAKKEEAHKKREEIAPPKESSYAHELIAQKEETESRAPTKENGEEAGSEGGPIINFSNVSITEILKYISRLTGKNFIYDPNELQFNITMISETPTNMEDLMAMVLQSLQIHGYLINEEENGFIIHANPAVKTIPELQPDKRSIDGPQITTQVFALQNTSADKCAAIVQAMASDSALVATVSDSKLIVTDISENIYRIEELIHKLDLGTNDVIIGQYVVVNSSPYALSTLIERIVTPLAANKTFVLVPHSGSNSIYIISSPYLVEKTLGIAQMVDLSRQKSGVLSSEYKFNPDLQEAALKRAFQEQEKGGLSKLDQLTREDIDRMSLEEEQAELMKRGYTLEEVLALPPDITRTLLWQLIVTERDAKQKALSQKLELGEDTLPFGRTESTHFYIHKLQYRKSTDVATALRAIASSMLSVNATSDTTSSKTTTPSPDLSQSDLVITLNSLQPLDDNNTIVFTGTRASISKVKELIAQIDLPVRQVFIEALVLDTTLTDSLNFGVEWGFKVIAKNFGAQMGFINPSPPGSNFDTPFKSLTINDMNVVSPVHITPPNTAGLSGSSIGRKIKFHGKGFRSTGALINALQANDEVHIILNPKIVTEHNVPAEIFVGQQVPIKGQSIANATTGSTSSIVATNYETKNVGISLKVTPLISSKETVTLIVEQKISTASAAQVAAQGGTSAPPATINETRATTRVHLPSDHFLVLSGMIQESLETNKNQTPCLGGLPLIGSLFGNKLDSTNNRNIMIFIRPIIIDNETDIDEITKRQDQVAKEKSKIFQGWDKQIDTAKMILNLEPQ